MSDITVILDQKDLIVSLESETLRVDKPRGLFERIPLNMIEKLIVNQKTMISSDVWNAFSQRNIPAIIFTSRNRKNPTYLGLNFSSYKYDRRIRQTTALLDPSICLQIGKWLLDEKLEGQECVLRHISTECDNFCKAISTHRSHLRSCQTTGELMGHEGAAARAYFQGFVKVLPQKWQFAGRKKRPSKDPINALLSYTYVIVSGNIQQALIEKGLDTSLSFLHSLQPGRMSLIYDIMEPLRPLLDHFVFKLLDNPITPGYFISNKDQVCYLNQQGRKAFFSAMGRWNDTFLNYERSLPRTINSIIDDLIDFFPDIPQSIQNRF